MDTTTAPPTAMDDTPVPTTQDDAVSLSDSLIEDTEGPFQEVTCRKKRRCSSRNSGSSDATIVTLTEPTVGLVVLFTPLNPDESIDSIDSVRDSNTLETLTTRVLLGLTTLCGMKVRAFEPRGKVSSVGIVRNVDIALSDAEIVGALRSSVSIRCVLRLGKSSTVRIEFSSATLPQHIYVGLVRHEVDLYVNNPLQCHRCGLFGHVAASCKRKLACLRCAQPHDTAQCDASDLHCVNCNKSHEATSHICPFWQAERTVCRYRCENNHKLHQKSSALLRNTPKGEDVRDDARAVNIDPGTTSVPVSSVNKNEKRSFKDVLCSSPRSSVPQVQMRPTPKPAQELPDTAPENADSHAIESTDLVLLNDGSPTFFGHRGKPSVLDLSFASPDLDVYWSLDVDTRGNDHLPVLMSIPRVGRLPPRLYHVTNWDLFRKTPCAPLLQDRRMGGVSPYNVSLTPAHPSTSSQTISPVLLVADPMYTEAEDL
ncbi:hypothetical protein HPB47_014012 [Ixodes persulcatus]|uniref:Uncharacterized protein n=1 Tax=Ixodes persulcatus TaxID=34615 RepID=A0AC60QZJ1_IXOPE|nr:hypothetical protein HPB47_014012 [Ixodes persulcatus]